ncbi:hypothetical protein [Spirillospora sp. NPDC047279]|uniref:hypothetical protein n=1 Tax=Spirillospora sp. NPDC047279 TaxID=3155478 RepID=UPI0033D29927
MPWLRPSLRLNAADRARLDVLLAAAPGPEAGGVLDRVRQARADGHWHLEAVRFRADSYSRMLAAVADPDAEAWAAALSWFGARISGGSAPLYAHDRFERQFGAASATAAKSAFVSASVAAAPQAEEPRETVRPHIEVSDADMTRLATGTGQSGTGSDPGEEAERQLARLLLSALDALATGERFVRIAHRHAASLARDTTEGATAWAEALSWAAVSVDAPEEAHARLLRRFPGLSPAAPPVWG